MEVSEFTKMVLDRIQIIEPENATKIIGYLLLKHSHQEILAFALGPEENIQSLINEAKSFLTSSSRMPIDPTPIQPHLIQAPQYFPPQTISRPFPLQSSFRVPALNLSPLYPYNDFTRIPQTQEHANALSSLGDLDYPGNCFYPPICFSEPTKPCHFYFRGHCKRGNSCKYLHDLTNAYEAKKILTNDPELPSPSLEQLEFEIIELLKESERMPVSIASLPSMYSEKYGKNLQAEGYLTESQRHGKAGFSLTKLLARLNCVRIIDRPHGQHAVVLLEDIPKYEYRDERNDSGDLSRSAHQIYLTFAAESTFTNEDVANYFTQYGPVREVRIPLQEKRMFGFVSFLYSDTVKIILSLGNPHLICGSRVLVKPYKDKTRNNERKYTERAELPVYNPPNYSEILSDWTLREFQNSNLRKQMLEEDDLALELESRRLLGLQLNPNPVMPYSYYNYGTDDLQTPTDYSSAMHIAASDDQHQQTENDFSDQDSNHVELPDNPFD